MCALSYVLLLEKQKWKLHLYFFEVKLSYEILIVCKINNLFESKPKYLTKYINNT